MDKIRIDFNPQPILPLRPELLQHPPIPSSLHGVNPRIIKGQDWWDTVRRKVYRRNNWCCEACGSNENVQAHEAYAYDYENLVARLDEVVCLCKECHQFIHSSMLYRSWVGGTVSIKHVLYILRRGRRILSSAGLNPHSITMAILHKFEHASGSNIQEIAIDKFGISKERFESMYLSTWVLEFDGEVYNYFSDVVREARNRRRKERLGV